MRSARPERTGPWPEAALVVCTFAVLGVAATWPLVAHLGSSLPSDVGDPVLNAWILGWDAARLRHGLERLWDAPNFFPYHHTLAYSDHLLGMAIFTAPVQWLTGNPVLTYNVAYIASWVLSGAGMYALVRSLTGRRDAAWIAAAAYAFTPFRAAHLAHVQWLTIGWLPLSLWALHRYFRTGAWRFAGASAAFFLLQALTASYFMYFALIPIACVVFAELRRTTVPLRKLAVHTAIVLVLLGAAIAPIAMVYYSVRTHTGLRRELDDIARYSADLGDLFHASHDLRIWRVLPPGPAERELFPGVATVALAAIALVALSRRVSNVVTYGIVAAAAFVLALGPAPAAWGHRLPVPGPYRLLLAIVPGLDGLRAPGRLVVVVVLALAVLAGYGAAWFIDRVPARWRRGVAAALVAAVIADGWVAPLRLAAFDPGGDPRDRAVYDYLRTQPKGGVMELPVSIEEPLWEFRYEYMTLVHGHPVVNGHSGYSSPLLDFLGSGHSPWYDFDHLDAALAMLSGLGVGYVVCHRGDAARDALCGALVDTAAAHRERVMATRDFGTAVVLSLPYQPLPRVPDHVQLLPATQFTATASSSPDRLPFAFDGDPDSRWLSGEAQAGNEWIDLALDRPRDIGFVRMTLAARSFGDYPRRLAIDVTDERGTRTLYDGPVLPQFAAGLVAHATYPAIDVVLPPNHARSIRLRQTSTTRTFFWSIHELQLWEIKN